MSSVWKLERYSRYVTEKNHGKGGWEVYESEKAELNLTLTECSFLVICHGTTVIESHSVVTSRAWMRGLVIGDSMMFLYKVKGNTRKFKIKFKSVNNDSGIKLCSQCTEKLSKYFPIKINSQSTTSQSQEATQDPNGEQVQGEAVVETLEGEITLSKMAEVLSGKLKANLPKAYEEHKYPTEETGLLLRLCLTDPSFPAFVEHVEKELKNIINESEPL
ncbi:meiotic recombination protein REC114 [Patella vulgata]|uniref:meiotic recombination protein REC114 n=1 Tax=Patella vulgata TaxID=6465 RepID=UPI00217F478C|nr:meiotic recombination protein REC114 [Patella vulgata]